MIKNKTIIYMYIVSDVRELTRRHCTTPLLALYETDTVCCVNMKKCLQSLIESNCPFMRVNWPHNMPSYEVCTSFKHLTFQLISIFYHCVTTNFTKRSFSYILSKTWNILLLEMRLSPTFHTLEASSKLTFPVSILYSSRLCNCLCLLFSLLVWLVCYDYYGHYYCFATDSLHCRLITVSYHHLLLTLQ